MIRAVAEDKSSGKAIVLLGLSSENITALQKDMPIRVNLKQLDLGADTTRSYFGVPFDLPDIDVVIFAGPPGTTEDDLLAEFSKRGMVPTPKRPDGSSA